LTEKSKKIKAEAFRKISLKFFFGYFLESWFCSGFLRPDFV
jgi:hypothetical protein